MVVDVHSHTRLSFVAYMQMMLACTVDVLTQRLQLSDTAVSASGTPNFMLYSRDCHLQDS